MFRAEAEGDFVAFDISIIWDGGGSHATWSLDISEYEAISMASSAPIYGWASWRNGDDLLLAYQSDAFPSLPNEVDTDYSPTTMHRVFHSVPSSCTGNRGPRRR
jgi:hypothetical protein